MAMPNGRPRPLGHRNFTEKVTLSVLDERIKNLSDTINEVKDLITNIKGCIDETRIETTKLKVEFNNHVKEHEQGIKWIMWVPSLLAVIIALASFLVK